MTRDEVVDILLRRLTRFNDTVMQDYVVDELQLAQRRLEKDTVLPWFLISEIVWTDTDIDEERVPTPQDFLREVDEDAVWYRKTDGTRKPLRKMTYDDMTARFSEVGEPVAYALLGRYFRVKPLPTVGTKYRIEMIYYKKDLALDSNIENCWLEHYPDLMMAEAGRILAKRYLKNDQLVRDFAEDIMTEKRRLAVHEQARKDANRDYWLED
jgi:hypothetical protein